MFNSGHKSKVNPLEFLVKIGEVLEGSFWCKKERLTPWVLGENKLSSRRFSLVQKSKVNPLSFG